jgi:hypothetical protein
MKSVGVYECDIDNVAGQTSRKYFAYATNLRKWTSSITHNVSAVQGHPVDFIVCPLADLVSDHLHILKGN